MNEPLPLVVYWNNIATPYMTDRFNAMSSVPEVRFEAWFCALSSDQYQWADERASWQFPHRVLPRLPRTPYIFATPLASRRSRPDVMVCLYESPSFVLGWAWAKLAGVRVYLWCEATPELNRTGSRVRRMVKSFMFRHTNLILTPGRDADAFVTEFGGARARSRIRRLRHVIDYAHYSGKISDASSRHRLRDEWGVPDDETVFLCVGRFLEPKGTVHAVEAFSLLPPEVLAKSQLVLVGDGSDREQIVATIAEKGLGSRVKLVDFAQREELPGVYAAGDVLVFPTLGDTYGLVVDEALAAGLPVVASIHACEIAGRMAGNHHGLLADPRRTDDFARAMADMTTWDLSTAARHQRSRTVAQLTPELWARRLIAIVQDDLKGDRAISPVMRNVQEGEVSG